MGVCQGPTEPCVRNALDGPSNKGGTSDPSDPGPLWAFGQRCCGCGQTADQSTQINCNGSSPPASPITTISFPPTSFSTRITQCALSISSLFYLLTDNPSAYSLFTNPSHALPTVPISCDFLLDFPFPDSLVRQSLAFHCINGSQTH
jgi:hypothetical protein